MVSNIISINFLYLDRMLENLSFRMVVGRLFYFMQMSTVFYMVKTNTSSCLLAWIQIRLCFIGVFSLVISWVLLRIGVYFCSYGRNTSYKSFCFYYFMDNIFLNPVFTYRYKLMFRLIFIRFIDCFN